MMGPQRMWVSMCRAEARAEQRGRCFYCHAPISKKAATADHVWPRSKGGPTSRGNIKAACKPCNLSKGSMSRAQFIRAIKSPSSGMPLGIWQAHFRRRLWQRTWRAVERIERAAA